MHVNKHVFLIKITPVCKNTKKTRKKPIKIIGCSHLLVVNIYCMLVNFSAFEMILGLYSSSCQPVVPEVRKVGDCCSVLYHFLKSSFKRPKNSD